MMNVYVSTAIKRDGVLEEERPHAEPPSALTPSRSTQQQQSRPAAVGTSEKALMKRTLVAQSKKIQQLMTKVDSMEAEREAMRQQVDELRMAVFEASTRAEQNAEQCKRDAVDAAVHEITRDREAFAEGRREALKRIGELEDALEIALKAAGGVHKQLLELGLSCEDLGKTSVHLSIAAKEAPAEDKPALAVAGETIEAIVGVMRTMEGSGVFDILDPVDEESDDPEEDASPFALADAAANADAAPASVAVEPLDGVADAAEPLQGAGSPSSAAPHPTTPAWDVRSGGGGGVEEGGSNDHDDYDGRQERREEAEEEGGEGKEEGEREKDKGVGGGEGQEEEEEGEEEGEEPRQPAFGARVSDEGTGSVGRAEERGREGRSISASLKQGSAEWNNGSAVEGLWRGR